MKPFLSKLSLKLAFSFTIFAAAYIVNDTPNKLDPSSIGNIETLYEQYLYKDDFCKMLMDLVKEMSYAEP